MRIVYVIVRVSYFQQKSVKRQAMTRVNDQTIVSCTNQINDARTETDSGDKYQILCIYVQQKCHKNTKNILSYELEMRWKKRKKQTNKGHLLLASTTQHTQSVEP